jgi:hypothetical protein
MLCMYCTGRDILGKYKDTSGFWVRCPASISYYVFSSRRPLYFGPTLDIERVVQKVQESDKQLGFGSIVLRHFQDSLGERYPYNVTYFPCHFT